MTAEHQHWAAPRRRRWASALAASVAGAATATAIAVPTTVHVMGDQPHLSGLPSILPPPAVGNHAVCTTYDTAGQLMAEAANAAKPIPPGMALTDPAVKADPALRAAADRSRELYGTAGNKLLMSADENPGVDLVLGFANTSLGYTLNGLSEAIMHASPAAGDFYVAAQAADRTMASLCNKLDP